MKIYKLYTDTEQLGNETTTLEKDYKKILLQKDIVPDYFFKTLSTYNNEYENIIFFTNSLYWYYQYAITIDRVLIESLVNYFLIHELKVYTNLSNFSNLGNPLFAQVDGSQVIEKGKVLKNVKLVSSVYGRVIDDKISSFTKVKLHFKLFNPASFI